MLLNIITFTDDNKNEIDIFSFDAVDVAITITAAAEVVSSFNFWSKSKPWSSYIEEVTALPDRYIIQQRVRIDENKEKISQDWPIWKL